MKVTITKIDANTYHFEEDGKLQILTNNDVVLEKKTGAYWLKLPENSTNRKLINVKKFDKEACIELTYKTPITLSTRENSEPKKPLEDYLEGEDRIIYLELVEKAKKNRAEATKKKPMTELEKAEAKVARLMAQIEEMKKNGAEA